ncbi:MAG: 3-oxoacid CoA-transferase subunit B [Chloroflexi bacterium]|nr:3-oxoacid CoA-transferase subunit B [Chloroflexota bacterium]
MAKVRLTPELMAMRAAQELPEGAVVNLGIGMPTLVANHIPPDRLVILHSENGVVGYGPFPPEGQGDPDVVNAGGEMATLKPGACFVHHADSFAIIRGGHVDVAILGAYQVSEQGDLANWMIPARGIGSIGGAADLAAGARKLIALMEHTTRDGQPRILRRCTYPLTGRRCVRLVITDLAVIEVTPRGLLLKELAPGWTAKEVQELTEPELLLAPDLRAIEV